MHLRDQSTSPPSDNILEKHHRRMRTLLFAFIHTRKPFLTIFIIFASRDIMTQIESPGLLTLPDEVIQTILSYTPPRSVVSAHATCRRLATIANGPLLWRSFCSSAFKWWDDRHDYKSKLSDPSFTGWETLYAERHLASQRTREVLARLLHDGEGKLDAIQQLLDIGYDAKDVLIDASQNARSSDSYLAQRSVSLNHASFATDHVKVLEPRCSWLSQSLRCNAEMVLLQTWSSV